MWAAEPSTPSWWGLTRSPHSMHRKSRSLLLPALSLNWRASCTSISRPSKLHVVARVIRFAITCHPNGGVSSNCREPLRKFRTLLVRTLLEVMGVSKNSLRPTPGRNWGGKFSRTPRTGLSCFSRWGKSRGTAQRFSFRPGTNGSRFFGKEARRFSRDQAFGLSSKQGAPEASEASAPALRRFLLASAVSATSRSGSPLSSQGVPSSCDNWLNKCRLCQELHFLKLTVGFDYRFGQGLVLPAPTRCVFFKIFVQNIHQILELLSVKYCE